MKAARSYMKFSAVIFDLFGTLVDDFVAATGPMNAEMATALNVPLEQFKLHWGQASGLRILGTFQTVEASIEHVCDLMGVRPTARQMAKAVEIRLRYIRQALTPRPNAIATLTQLKKAGCKIGLLSNCSIEIPILWPETEFVDLVESPVFSARVRLRKPDPRIYHLTCERLGVMPDASLYLADGENHELAAAAKVGLHAVLLRNSSRDNGHELLREAREWQGDIVEALPEVINLVSTNFDRLTI
jgi:putative hydrolase of the HAD superfamily